MLLALKSGRPLWSCTAFELVLNLCNQGAGQAFCFRVTVAAGLNLTEFAFAFAFQALLAHASLRTKAVAGVCCAA